LLVVAISDAAATQRTVQLARALSPGLPILVRTQYVQEIDQLCRLGADEVVPEEFEAGVEMCQRVLRRVGIPGNLIARELRGIREDHYRMFRDPLPSARQPGDLPEGLLSADVETHTLLAGAWAVGRSLKELHLRGRTGATVIALMQDGQVVPSPEPERPLSERETVVLMGSFEQIALARHLMDQGPEGSPVRDPLPLQR
jgi:CPA2 family monovalent cation:H+ antiporter-2